MIANRVEEEFGGVTLLQEFCDHYGTAVLPARPAHPRDKPKAEAAVLLVERWILARLRNRRFFSLAELNAAIRELLAELNARPFKKLPGCRREAFERLDQPALRPLPPTRMPIVRFKSVGVNIDYHVELDGHYYSVPHRLVHKKLELRVSSTTVEAFFGQQRAAVHAYSAIKGAFTTLPSLELATMPQTWKENQEGLNEGYYSHCSFRSPTEAVPAALRQGR